MNTTEALSRRHYLESLAGIQLHLAGRTLPWLARQRDRAIDAFETLDFPTRQMEAWRYSGADKLLEHRFKPVTESFAALQDLDVDELQIQSLDAHRLVFANGRFVPSLSFLQELPPNVIVGSLHQALKYHPDKVETWLGSVAQPDRDTFVAMNSAEINDGLFVYVPDHLQIERPIEVLYLTLGLEDAIVAQPRNLVVLGQGARATLIERYASTGSSVYFNNGLSEVMLKQAAELEHVQLQQESPHAYHLHSRFVAQGAASRYQSTSFALSGGWARNETDLRFTAEGAEASLAGLFTAGNQQLNDVHLNIDHAVPGCISQSDFKGLLHGKGRGVFDGRILVGAKAQHTEAHLNNANLLLSRNAEVDTKPQLEIYADNVKCSHGTTVGQLEESQLFYLRSRGIDAAQAKRLLCLGFAGEILDKCEITPLREVIENELVAMLAGVDMSHYPQEA
jgi:Fe-S cluster assembly protein SufD